MRKRLNAFSEFAKTILPNEIDFLIASNQLQDEDRLAILERIRSNISQHPPEEAYDLSIDKRTYSHLKNWIVKQLCRNDVDEFYHWISEIDVKIVHDSISPEEERKFLKLIQEYEAPGFYFTRLFEVLQHYSNFLLIRLRYKDHQIVDDLLNSSREAYLRHKGIEEKLREASTDIVKKYNQRGGLPKWKGWLSDIFEDESVQGYFRYQALIRLHFMDLHAEDNSELLDQYAVMGRYFSQGKFYSKRLLVNYYHNLMLLHHKNRQYEEALQYGYLSTRVATHDFLLHVNNLCDVLVHLKRYEEGLKLLRSASKEARNTNNFFNRVGYVSSMMRCLIGTGNPASAVSYGSSFLGVYKKEIMKYRWFRFFYTFLEALVRAGEFKEVIRVGKKHRLLELEAKEVSDQDGYGKLTILTQLANYLAGELDRQEFEIYLTGLETGLREELLEGKLPLGPFLIPNY